MELRRRLSPKYLLIGVYVLAFLVYIIIGLQPAEAADYDITGKLNVPSIGLSTDVTKLALNNHKLDTPDTMVGSYARAENKTLLIGHAATVFQELDQVELGDKVDYNEAEYKVVSIETLPKSRVEMNKILAGSSVDTIVIMTCAGELLDGGDATHRLMVTAVRD